METAPPSVNESLARPGAPMPVSVRHEMEQRFRYDFSRVRVHDGVDAAVAARAVDARAFTVGRDIVFGSGEYAHTISGDRHLLAHELTHVIQQDNAPQSARLQRTKCGTPTLRCPPRSVRTNESSNPMLGMLVHNIVMEKYVNEHRAGLGEENFILVDRGWGEVHTRAESSRTISRLMVLDPPVHGSFSRPAKRSERGSGSLEQRPDILDDQWDTLHEIKSCTPEGEQEGRNDLVDYFSRLAGAPEKVPPSGRRRTRRWHTGSWMPDDFEYGQGPLPFQVVFSSPQRGLILYSIWTCRPTRRRDDEEGRPEDQPLIGERPFASKGDSKSTSEPKDKNDRRPGQGDRHPDKGNGGPDNGKRRPSRTPSRDQPQQPTFRLPEWVPGTALLAGLAAIVALLSKHPLGRLGALLGTLLGRLLVWLGLSIGLMGAAAASSGGGGGSSTGGGGNGSSTRKTKGNTVKVPGEDTDIVPGKTVTIPGNVDPTKPREGTTRVPSRAPVTSKTKAPPTKTPRSLKQAPKRIQLAVIEGLRLDTLSVGKLGMVKIDPGGPNERVVVLKVRSVKSKGNDVTAEFESVLPECSLKSGKCSSGGNIYSVTHPYRGAPEDTPSALAIEEVGNTEGMDETVKKLEKLIR